MKKVIPLILIGLILTLVVAPSCVSLVEDQDRNRVDELNKQLHRVEVNINSFREEVETLNDNLNYFRNLKLEDDFKSLAASFEEIAAASKLCVTDSTAEDLSRLVDALEELTRVVCESRPDPPFTEDD